jgi:MFS transporter, MFS domain-containing protein family, molybdate-anion transporter
MCCSGRKKAGLAYVLTYCASCITKHWSSYGVLMAGRLLGGIATSLLFSAFESWLVSEHMSVRNIHFVVMQDNDYAHH